LRQGAITVVLVFSLSENSSKTKNLKLQISHFWNLWSTEINIRNLLFLKFVAFGKLKLTALPTFVTQNAAD